MGSIKLGNLRWGTRAERLAATNVPGGTVWYEEDFEQWWGRTPGPGGTLIWAAFDASLTNPSWSKYVVAPPSGGGVIQPPTLYTDIQDAIDAALADNHDDANPAVVMLLPGTHTWSGTLPAGINLEGLGTNAGQFQDVTGSVVVVGTITLANAGTQSNQLLNLEVNGSIIAEGDAYPIMLRGVKVVTTVDGDACLRVNVDLAVFADDCAFYQQNTDTAAVEGLSVFTGRFANCTIYNGSRTRRSLDISDAVNFPEPIEFDECLFQGVLRVSGRDAVFARCRMLTTGTPFLQTVHASTRVYLDDTRYDATASPAFTGPGVVFMGKTVSDHFYDFGVGSGGAGVMHNAYNRQLDASVDNAAITGQAGEIIELQASAPGSTPILVAMQSVVAVGAGREFTFLNTGDATDPPFVLVASGAERFGRHANSPTSYVLWPGDSVRLVANFTQYWEVVGGRHSPPTNLDIYVSAVGLDTNSGITAAAPLATLGAALQLAARTGWLGYCHVNMTAATHVQDAGVNLAIPVSSAKNAEPLCIVGTMSPSGLGTRTVSASSAGSGATFGTVTDSVGGLTVNAWRGYFLRYTSGTQSGKSYVIASNTASIFTIVGTQVVPTNGDTFVVESPGTDIRSSNNLISFTGSAGTMVGLSAVLLNGQSSASSQMVFRGISVYHTRCWFSNWLSMFPTYAGSLWAMRASLTVTTTPVFPSLAQPNTVGSFFGSNVASASISSIRGSNLDFQQCLVNGYLVTGTGGSLQFTSSCGQGNFGLRGVVGCSMQLGASRLETASGIVGDYNTAGIVVDEGSQCSIQNVDVTNCTGIAMSVTDNATVKCLGLTGSGNAGVPVTLRIGAKLVKSSGNSVTGAVAGQDVTIGSRVNVAWATVNAGTVPDNGAVGTNEFCVASN